MNLTFDDGSLATELAARIRHNLIDALATEIAGRRNDERRSPIAARIAVVAAEVLSAPAVTEVIKAALLEGIAEGAKEAGRAAGRKAARRVQEQMEIAK